MALRCSACYRSQVIRSRSIAPLVVRCQQVAEIQTTLKPPAQTGQVRVRFAPSPTGNLHVGGARTALFNWLFAKHHNGKMVLRVEDTDQARSTLESENAVLRDLKWLGIQWDEGPDVGGPHGPYRQSERAEIYKQLAQQLVQSGHAYPCFCTEEELDAMKKEANEKGLPPIYRGKWSRASKEEVQEMMSKGAPYVYRFRVPKDSLISIQDAIRGEVTWNTNTLGDFVLLRSNGLPVYNFCVAVDDALMGITDVIRAEEHLPNTLRQILIYNALGFKPPRFGHASLILAPDKSKLSKRHGATSVNDFREEGYLPDAMVNFLALLGWNDGTEQEIFKGDELWEKFTLDRVSKAGAVFDKEKLSWMNGQYLRQLPDDVLFPRAVEALVQGQIIKDGSDVSPDFVKACVDIVKDRLELLQEFTQAVSELFTYPLEETLQSSDAQPYVEDELKEFAQKLIEIYDNGTLATALSQEGQFKKLLKELGKEMGRKGKRLFMPLRICMTGRMAGPDVGQILQFLMIAEQERVLQGNEEFQSVHQRLARLDVAHVVLLSRRARRSERRTPRPSGFGSLTPYMLFGT
eukprot:TRINITY_DN5185_c0_g1_i9.p1 TRINITY_DN5185_c0_g1~~TRINITY_DN5185_c0_g1_i9.p1  ORF type:complete len:589 (-),score=73.83 TRINITY_DN5185_c0_g1_i9:89-1816(-)